jgi:3-hydroxyisobutyrate dehydrogenase-like beta-hydroxyacid dehydrogenase
MSSMTVAILMPGDMGHGVGRALGEHGVRVVSSLAGRSDHTCGLAKAAGIEDLGSLEAVVTAADLILSILPPASALPQAKQVSAAMRAAGQFPVYADCNAVSPETALAVGQVIADAGAAFIDAGIIGLAPGKSGGTRFYVSGHDVSAMMALDGMGFSVIPIGDAPGRASALKMAYAGLTKGTWTLHTAVLLAASQLGVLPELLSEFATSQQGALEAMRNRVPRLPADSGRWIGEMEEIADTFAAAGVTPDFHNGAAEVFRVLSRTPFAEETRETMDTTRTLEASLAVYREALDQQ